MRLFVVRHAEAEPGQPDELRALSGAGREAARALGERLAREGVRLDALLTSPLLRARETGAALGKALGVSAEADERLAPGATGDGVRGVVRGRGNAVAVVGHEPDCGRIVADLTGGPAPAFSPAAVRALDLDP